jgi:hypothetical protein
MKSDARDWKEGSTTPGPRFVGTSIVSPAASEREGDAA